MGRTKSVSTSVSSKRMRPALTPEAREKQLISLAVDLAEKKLIDGTASSQVITHYLKLGSTREKLEQERMEVQNDLMRAKKKAIDSTEEMKVLYKDAIDAFRVYSGQGDKDD